MGGLRKKLIYILKHNRIIQSLYKGIAGVAIRFLGLFIRQDCNLALFVSFAGMRYNDSPQVIFERIRSCSDYDRIRCIWAFEDPDSIKREHPELECVKIDSLQYFRTALKAKYWVTNTNIERGLRFKKKATTYLNTWHGVPLKLIGNDCPGRNDFDFSTVDYMVVSGEYEEKVFQTAFLVKQSQFLRSGLPRNEELWNATSDTRRIARDKLGLSENQKVILYAPTWRDSTDGGATYAIAPPVHFDLWKEMLGEEFVVLFRAHHQTTKVMNLQFNEFVVNVSDYNNVNELMIASDILITDYSAIAFDYSILCRPIFCYTYDYETYLAERGTYFEMDEKYPNKTCKSEEELLNRINSYSQEIEESNTRRFRDIFVQYGEMATQECVRALFGE